MRFTRLLLILLFFPLAASAQFYVTGDDPGRLKWNFIDTESYRIIYPQGTDSLAKVYGRKLEKYKIPVSRTAGYVTGEGDGKLMPVVMHTRQDANGSVAWAPKRMDLFTVPTAYDPEPLPWSTMLSVHESRHVSQMQFGLTEKQKPGKWFLGQGWNIIAFLLYPGTANVEGDAVVAETALTPSGRGRTADFLNYYWVAFDHGDFRGWFKWRYMSQLRYSPTYYALGYMTIGGYRYLYDRPYFMSEGLHRVAAHPAKLGCLYDVGRNVSGKKWNDAWLEICDTMYGKWKENADRRAPYIPSERVLPEPKRHTDYTGNFFVENELYSIRSGHVDPTSIVRIDSLGKEHHVCYFSSSTNSPQWSHSHGFLYWSESIPHTRWTLQNNSRIVYADKFTGARKRFRSRSLLYNPVAEDSLMSAVRYHVEGRTSVDILDIESGETVKTFDAPDSLQLVESAWLEGKIYATAISEYGYGFYCLDTDSGEWSKVLGPQPVMVKNFGVHDKDLTFTCDRTGVNEVYHYSTATGELKQKTSTRYGAEEFHYNDTGDYLYYSSQTLKGKHLFRTRTSDLLDRTVRFDSLYRYPIAEKITQQEKEAAKAQGYDRAVSQEEVQFSEPKRYRKVPHAFNLHTWFPAYISVHNIMNDLSFDPLWQTLSLGVSGVLQNHLSTAVGEIGYSAHKDPYNASRWRHSEHFKFTYSGLFPIFQFAFDINDRGARQMTRYADAADGKVFMVDSRELSAPYMRGKADMYIPFNLSSGGWSRGVVPHFSYTVSNDIFDTGTVLLDRGQTREISSFSRYVEGKKKIRQSVSGSVRAYTMLHTANSQVYPRWGVGAEVGALSSIESFDVFSPMGYVYGYGYVPGIMKTHGIRLSALWQTKLRESSPFSQQMVDILPRGLGGNSELGSYVSLYHNHLVKLTADYAIPIYIGDITIGGNWLAIKRLVAYPHFDYSFIGNKGLWSAGLDLTADLHAIITLEWPCSVGVTFSWNGGSAWGQLEGVVPMNRWFVGPVFNVSF